MLNLLNRAEFRRHRTAEATFVEGFLKEWEGYYQMLSEQLGSSGSIGRELANKDREILSDEQQQQLQQLKESVQEKKSEVAYPSHTPTRGMG